MITEKNTKKEILEAFNNLMADQEKTLEALEKAETEKAQLLSNAGNSNSDDGPITVVIPYVKKFAQGNELKLALRGWAKNYKNDFTVVVIGDREDWMGDELHVIECDRVGNNPPIDIANKMMLAIESDLVSELFIWANDDQYMISPCIYSDIVTFRSVGDLDNNINGTNLYQRNKRRTLDILKKLKKPTRDYSAHLPFFFYKESLKEMIEEYKMTEEAYLIASMYYNIHYPEFVPYNVQTQQALEFDNVRIGVYRPNADLNKLKQLMPRKKWINNSQSGWSAQLSDILNNHFKEKCRFEK